METLSVVIPTYNRAKDLKRAVLSVMNQTRTVAEIIICDDGSGDNSKEIISELGDDRIIWIDCGRNGRPAIPRNYGITKTTGDWVAFLDDDDEWLPEKIEKQLQVAFQLKCKAVCCNAFRRIDGAIREEKYVTFDKHRITFNDLIRSNYVICSSAVVHRSLLNHESFPEEEMLKSLEDYVLWLKIAVQTDFAFMDAPLVVYNDNPLLSIRSESKDTMVQRQMIFKNLISWANTEKTIDKRYKESFKIELKRTREGRFNRFIKKLY